MSAELREQPDVSPCRRSDLERDRLPKTALPKNASVVAAAATNNLVVRFLGRTDGRGGQTLQNWESSVPIHHVFDLKNELNTEVRPT